MKIGCSARITTMFEVQKLLWMPNQMAGTMSNSIIKLSGIFDILTTINNSTRPAETYIRILSSAYGQSRRNYLRITFSRPCDERDMSNFSTRKTNSNSGCSFKPHYTKRHENLDNPHLSPIIRVPITKTVSWLSWQARFFFPVREKKGKLLWTLVIPTSYEILPNRELRNDRNLTTQRI